MYRFLADAVLAAHLVFIGFVLGGGLLALWRQRLAWIHIPAAAWGALIEITGWICPLTPLENHFLQQAGEASYQGDFIARYLMPIIYPAGLTPTIQKIFGVIVIIVNCIIYAAVVIKARRQRRA